MKFDYNLKKEIIDNIADDSSFLQGMIISSGRIEKTADSENICISHIIYHAALKVITIIKGLYKKEDTELTFEEPKGNKKARAYVVIVDAKTTKQIMQDFALIENQGALNIRKSAYGNYQLNELIGFLQGIYMGKGRVFLPKDDIDSTSSYQLEMVLDSKGQMQQLALLINSQGILIKEGERRDNPILYIKDSETISDFLALLKASNAVLMLQSLIIERDVRNNINRAVNCNVANINKTITAASEQIKAIMLIDQRIGLNSLDNKLKELAMLRLNNPEASLSDLAAMLSGEVTKSGINHRMRKIMEIADTEGRKGL